MKKIRQLFVRGLFSILPIALTIYVIYFAFSVFDNLLGNLVEYIIGRRLPGAGLAVSIVFILLTGLFVTNVLGAKIFKLGEKLLERIPLIPKIYFGVKQITEAFSLQGKQMFSKVALVEYPRKGTYAVGFVTGECRGEVQEKTDARLINVFIPTTPNPTSGMLILVPDKEVLYLDMSVEEGLKLIVSAGVVAPVQKGMPLNQDIANT